MLCSPEGFDLTTREGQIANIKAVRRRIAAGRCEGGTTPPRSSANLALGTQNQGESAPVIEFKECLAFAIGSLDSRELSECDTAASELPHPFDFCAFRTEPLDGEAEPGPLHFPAIVRLVCAEFGIAPAELWGSGRGAKNCFVRHACWWLARRWTTGPISYPTIGRLSVARTHQRRVGKDHSTVVHGVRRFDEWRAGLASYSQIPAYADWRAHRG